MPATWAILEGLERLANHFWWVALAWHALLAIALVALAAGLWRPDRRLAALATIAPLASVSALAWSDGNGFTGLLIGGLLGALAVVAARMEPGPARLGPPWAVAAGAGAVAYAWVYPHFLDGPAWALLVAAPMGVLPCPTLALVLGLGLVGGAFGSRAWAYVAAAAGLFYAAFGILRLGVWLDAGLLLAAVALFAWPYTVSPEVVAVPE